MVTHHDRVPVALSAGGVRRVELLDRTSVELLELEECHCGTVSHQLEVATGNGSEKLRGSVGEL